MIRGGLVKIRLAVELTDDERRLLTVDDSLATRDEVREWVLGLVDREILTLLRSPQVAQDVTYGTEGVTYKDVQL